jgi:hypothetical protein
MMHLTEVKYLEVIRKQYLYKMQSFSGSLLSLMIVQFIAFLISLGGTSNFSSGSNLYSITFSSYSSNLILAFTMIWALVTAINITTKTYRNEDFIFVTNRRTSQFANIAFLITASFLGSITAVMVGTLLKVIVQLNNPSEQVITHASSLQHISINLFGTFLYLLLLMAVGYFLGSLYQNKKMLLVFLPLGLFTIFIVQSNIVTFFIFENSFLLFSIKTISFITILLVIAFFVTKEIEVRSV